MYRTITSAFPVKTLSPIETAVDAVGAAASVSGVVVMLDDRIDSLLLEVLVVVEGDASVSGVAHPGGAVGNHEGVGTGSGFGDDAAAAALVLVLENRRHRDF